VLLLLSFVYHRYYDLLIFSYQLNIANYNIVAIVIMNLSSLLDLTLIIISLVLLLLLL
jgi:hypothetical protein